MKHSATPFFRRWHIYGVGLVVGCLISLYPIKHNFLLPPAAYGNAVTHLGQHPAIAQIASSPTDAPVYEVPWRAPACTAA